MATNGIKEIAINSTNYLIEPTLYTTIKQTSAATTFTADLANFELFTGVTVAIKFGVTNNDSATLNINGTGAKAIYYEGAAIAASKLKAQHTYVFTYNGAQWELIGDLNTDTNTHRSIQVNGTEVLGNNTTALNLKNGDNVSITNNSGTVTIAATDTTYTFENGTNGFKVTPLGGTAQTVTVTPSITNNITGSGTANYLTKFTAVNTIGAADIAIDSNNNLTIPSTLIKFTRLGEGLEFTTDRDYFDTSKDARIIQMIDTNATAGTAVIDGGLIIRAVGRNSSTDTVQELLRIRNHAGTTDWASGEFQWKTKDIVVETGDSKNWNIIANKASHATAAHWFTGSTHSTGVLKVKIKEKKAWMLTFTIRVYQSYKYDDYVISGYNYGTRHWENNNVVLLGSSETNEHLVVFGYDDDPVNNYCTLWVAIPIGDYTGIDIFNVTNGHNQVSDFSNLFEIVYEEETSVEQLSGETKSCFRPWYRNETVDAAQYLQGTVAYANSTIGETALTTNPGLGRIQYFYSVNNQTTGLFPHSNNANGLLTLHTYGAKYTHQLGFSSDHNLYHRAFSNRDINMDPTSWKQIAYTSSNITGSAASWATAQTAYVQLNTASTTTTINGGQSTAQVLGVNGILPITNGGTGAGTISAARANLGLGNGKMFYAVCETNADAADKVAVCAEFTNADFVAGTMVSVYFTNKNTAAVGSLTLSIAQDDQGTNATTAAPMKHIYNTSGLTNLAGASQLAAGSVIPFIYTGAVWQVIGLDFNNTYTLTEVWSNSSATAAAKVGGNGSYYYIQNPDDATSINEHYFEMTLRYANTKADELTLNIHSQGAKPIYINGKPSSSTNYKLPRGKYFVYYDGAHYNFRTDGIIPGKVERALEDENGDNITSTYLKSSNFSTTNFNVTTTNDTATIGLKVAAYDTLGVVKPAFSNTSSVTLSASSYTKTGISISRTSVADRYYGVEADANGRLYVNIPWKEYDNTISASYSRSDNRLTYSRKMYMIGRLAPVGDTSLLITDTGTGEVSHSFDPYIYATTTTGELSATSHALNVEGVEKAHITYNSTDDSIDFIFI